MTAVLKNAGVMHLTYYVNRLTITKVDSTYLAVNQQCITYMCSILTKGSTCRKNKKMIFLLVLIEQVMTNLLKKKISVLAQILTKLWSIYELHNYIILLIILNIII